ncbi:conserved hypothetical protein [Syntrophomonas wolfei subsp. wolfei str. Goettingen G311]|uniref:Fido domain-containing protein n=2 Tax=Syntrophomonas wolfei TaxID=863 RepID=Q0ATW8_SYNWW|nr:conserved hypothetical protein [Syntrophomonas wolfei subsp. wolfei str. Goettingen G311]
MMSFREDKLLATNVPMRIVSLISKINEYKGKQVLYNQQAPEVLNTLKNVAIIQSTRASNSLEGITIKDTRLIDIMQNKVQPANRSEGEIAGYRDVLATIHSSYDAIPVKPSILLQFHRDLYRFISLEGGSWKNSDNAIEEVYPDGSKFVRFNPVSSFATPGAIEELCKFYNQYSNSGEIDSLMLISATILDFLCIHPFCDGNGRMARLLTLLLLYKEGYEVGRFISLEQIIEESKDAYYDTLYQSSQNWHEGKHDLLIWSEYLLGIILAAYKELMDRVGKVSRARGNKAMRVEETIDHFVSNFSINDIRRRCPDISPSTINRVLAKLRDANKIEVLGIGRGAKWKKNY